jgi:hypothetical protein
VNVAIVKIVRTVCVTLLLALFIIYGFDYREKMHKNGLEYDARWHARLQQRSSNVLCADGLNVWLPVDGVCRMQQSSSVRWSSGGVILK